ncbi:hypothetical protein I3760_11G192500 [Carya illinoinensis]|nr:hypothetical protein I3760_11G192500 [Carya illinoinensis]
MEAAPSPPLARATMVDQVLKSFVQAVSNLAIQSFRLPMRYTLEVDGEQGFIFLEVEMTKATEDFKFAFLLKFSCMRPSIDDVRSHIAKSWGLKEVPVVIFMDDLHEPSQTDRWPTLTGKPPLVIARGGFSGLFPDSSQIAFGLARQVSLPNVHLWCDVQLTKDGFGICAQGVKLENDTNIATIYKNSSRVYEVNKVPTRGWFSVDFTYEELANNVALTQGVYSRSPRFDNHGFAIITVDHLATQVQPPGLWLNIQYDAFFTQHNLSMTTFVLSVSKRVKVDYISSPEVAFLTRIATGFKPTTTKLVFRFLGRNEIEPSTSQTYGSLLKNLTFVKTFASGILVPKDYIWPVDATLYLQPHTSVVADAHKAGLEVFASDFVNDIPISYNYSHDPISEYLSFVDNADFSVDGVLSDFPMTASEAIACFAHDLGRKASSQAKPLIISKYGASGDYPGWDTILPELRKFDRKRNSSKGCGWNIFLYLAWNQIQNLKPAIANPSTEYKMFRNPKFQNAGKFVTLSDFLALSKNTKSLTGVLINIENAQGVRVADAVNEVLIKAGFNKQTSLKVMIQSSNSSVLMKFKGKSNYECVYKADGSIADGPDSTIKNIKTFADSVVVTKDFIFPDFEAFITNTTDIVPKFHAEKLPVYVETFSNEFVTQSYDFLADATVEINTFVQLAKVDGIITDFPYTAARYKRNRCLGVGKKLPPYMQPITPGSLLLCSSWQRCFTTREPLVISRCGASADYPGCTNLAYTQAITDGVDVLDCPLQLAKDGTPFCLSSINLLDSTTVAESSYSNFTTSIPEIQDDCGIFTFSLTWSQIQELKRKSNVYQLLLRRRDQYPSSFLPKIVTSESFACNC